MNKTIGLLTFFILLATLVPVYADSLPPINSNTTLGASVVEFTLALIITMIIELIVGYAFVRKIKNYKRILVSIVIANLISLPIVWFLFITYQVLFQPAVLVSEAFAMIFEAFFIHLINKKLISLKKTIIMSIIMNLVSFFVGFIMLMLVVSYFQII